MAVLCKTEKLICEARKSSDKVLRYAFELTVLHIKINCSIIDNFDDLKYFNYLYRRNHSNLRFDNIAKNILHTSVSTLEDRRKKFVKIFNGYLENAEKIQAIGNEAAITKDE